MTDLLPDEMTGRDLLLLVLALLATVAVAALIVFVIGPGG